MGSLVINTAKARTLETGMLLAKHAELKTVTGKVAHLLTLVGEKPELVARVPPTAKSVFFLLIPTLTTITLRIYFEGGCVADAI